MWMMSCSSSGDHNGSGGFNISGPFTAPRKLRPLIPKPTSTTTSTSNGNAGSTSATHPCFNLIHGTDLFLLNHQLEQSRRDFPGPSVVSSRWNPTPEQLRTLQELYRRGTRTPSAEQIQQITAQLRRYGKIEGKNVFYWFQNHKARERQKRRRQSEDVHHNLETKESDIEAEEETEKNNWGLSTNLTSTLTHEVQSSVSMQEDGNSVSMQRPATTDHHQESNRTDGWIQLEDREFQQRRKPLDPFATWQNIHHLSSYCSPPPPHVNLLPTTSTISSTTAATLELFPLRKDENGGEKESEQGVATSASMNTNCTTYQFYKFL